MPDIKDHALSLSLSSIPAIAAAVGVVWFIVQPLLISQIGTALAEDVDKRITEKQGPLENAFASILKSEIQKLRRQIARMETHINDEDWDEDDADTLAGLHIELEALLDALEEL